MTPMAQPSRQPAGALRLMRRRMVEALAARQAGIVSRAQLYAHGITRGEVRANVRAGRWARIGTQSICVHRGPLTQKARHWAAVFEAGPRAYLDGGSALVDAGLTGFTMDRIRVSVPRGARVRRAKGLDIRQTRRWSDTDIDHGSLRRARPAVAAIRHALWARSDREAAYVLTAVVQQGLASAEALGVEMLRVRRHKRRGFIHGVLLDLIGGVRALGELDVARECRRRGLPEPNRQVLRKGRSGNYYLDVCWDRWKLVVEVDGIQHLLASHVVPDAIRQNDLAIAGNTVLRVPLLGLRVAPDTFYAQIEEALAAAGWSALGRRTA